MSNNSYSIKRVFKGATIYSSGQLLVKAGSFFLIPLYTRVLSPNDYGIFGYVQVFLQIATVIAAFGFSGSQVRYYYERKSRVELGRYLFTINAIPFLIVLIIFIPVSIFGIIFKWSFGFSEISFYPYLFFTMWTVCFQVLANNALAFYNAQQRFSMTSILQVTRFIAVTGLTLIFVLVFRLGVMGQIYGLFFGTIIFLFFSYKSYAKNFVWKISKSALKYAVAFGAPIVVHLLAGTIHNAIDRIILERYVSLAELGIYTLGFMIGNMMSVFLNSFNQAFQPNYFQLMESQDPDKNTKIIKTFKFWLIMITIIAVAGILLGKPFLKIFAGPKFSATEKIFPWIILAMFFHGFYFFFSSSIFYFKKTHYLPIITGIAAVTNIVLNIILIPKMSIVGAAVATCISHAVSSMLTYIIAGRLYRIKWPVLTLFSSLGIVSVAIFLSFYIH